MNQSVFRRFLWLTAFIVPIPAGAYAVHTPDSILIAAGVFFLLSLILPCVWPPVSGPEGKVMAAAHPVCAVCLNFWLDLSVFLWLLSTEKLSGGTNVVAQGILGLVGFTAALLAMFLLDAGCAFLYRRLKASWPRQVEWIVFAFYSGMIPGTVLATIAILSFAGADHGYAAVFFLVSGMVIMLYLKIVLAMVAVALYLFLGSTGNKWKRLTRAAFTGFFWLALVYASLSLSVAWEEGPGFLAWFDSSYFSAFPYLADLADVTLPFLSPSYWVIFPYLSDLWLAFVALYLGTRVTEWIWSG